MKSKWPDEYNNLSKEELIDVILKKNNEFSEVLEQYKEYKEHTDILLSGINVYIWLKDTKNHILKTTQVVADSLGLPISEIEGRYTPDLYPEMNHLTYYEDDLRVVKGKETIQGIVEPIIIDGVTRWYTTDKTPILDENGDVKSILVVATDITDLHGVQEELSQYKKDLEDQVQERTSRLEKTTSDLKRSNKDLEDFAYVISHDLQEPLRQIANFIQLFKHKYEYAVEAKGDYYINIVVDGAKRMQDLINDLMLFSRVGRDEYMEDQNCISMGQLIDDALTNISHLIEQSGAKISVEDQNCMVCVSEPQMLMVISNLVTNAVRFKKEDVFPEISISCKMCVDRDFCELIVSDNGIGIEEKFFDKIFVVFKRLHQPGKYPGTGVGLAICKRIVEAHGGKIWVESTVGEGSEFHCLVPCEKK